MDSLNNVTGNYIKLWLGLYGLLEQPNSPQAAVVLGKKKYQMVLGQRKHFVNEWRTKDKESKWISEKDAFKKWRWNLCKKNNTLEEYSQDVEY